MRAQLRRRSNFIVSRLIILAFSCAGIFFAAQFVQQAARDTFFRKISAPSNLITVEGKIDNELKPSWYLDHGYSIKTSDGRNIFLHCGPWPSWDDCLSPKRVNYKSNYDNLSVSYYRDKNGNDGNAYNVIVKIRDEANFDLIKEDEQIKRWKKISKEYDSSTGIYVAVEMDAAFWIIRSVVLLAIIILSASAAFSAKSLVSEINLNKGNS